MSFCTSVTSSKYSFRVQIQSVYRLTVMARPEKNRNGRIGSASADATKTSSGTTADVIVVVVDQNDNSPTVVYPSRSNRTVHVPARATVGHQVARIIARDPDAGENGRLTYEIVSVSVISADESALSGDVIRRRFIQYDSDDDGFASAALPSELFGIDADRGVTRSLADFNLDKTIFDIHISVADNGLPPRRASSVDVASLCVIVNATMPYGGALTAGDRSNDAIYVTDDDVDKGQVGLLGMLTRRAGLIAYIATAVGIGCCLAVAAPIGASVLVRRRRRSRKRKETDDRLQESLRSMLATDGIGVTSSATSMCDVVKTTTSSTTMLSAQDVTGPKSPYHQRNGVAKSVYKGTAAGIVDCRDGDGDVGDVSRSAILRFTLIIVTLSLF
jgi:hypothetical protein